LARRLDNAARLRALHLSRRDAVSRRRESQRRAGKKSLPPIKPGARKKSLPPIKPGAGNLCP
jgi:hypothetical protein